MLARVCAYACVCKHVCRINQCVRERVCLCVSVSDAHLASCPAEEEGAGLMCMKWLFHASLEWLLLVVY